MASTRRTLLDKVVKLTSQMRMDLVSARSQAESSSSQLAGSRMPELRSEETQLSGEIREIEPSVERHHAAICRRLAVRDEIAALERISADLEASLANVVALTERVALLEQLIDLLRTQFAQSTRKLK